MSSDHDDPRRFKIEGSGRMLEALAQAIDQALQAARATPDNTGKGSATHGAFEIEVEANFGPDGLHPNFPPVVSRVRRLFRPSWGASFVVLVSCFIPVFPAALHSLRAAEKLSGFGSEVGGRCTAPASSAGQAVRATAELR
jgi:hypothetical protein